MVSVLPEEELLLSIIADEGAGLLDSPNTIADAFRYHDKRWEHAQLPDGMMSSIIYGKLQKDFELGDFDYTPDRRTNYIHTMAHFILAIAMVQMKADGVIDEHSFQHQDDLRAEVFVNAITVLIGKYVDEESFSEKRNYSKVAKLYKSTVESELQSLESSHYKSQVLIKLAQGAGINLDEIHQEYLGECTKHGGVFIQEPFYRNVRIEVQLKAKGYELNLDGEIASFTPPREDSIVGMDKIKEKLDIPQWQAPSLETVEQIEGALLPILHHAGHIIVEKSYPYTPGEPLNPFARGIDGFIDWVEGSSFVDFLCDISANQQEQTSVYDYILDVSTHEEVVRQVEELSPCT